MKKHLSILFAIALLLCLCACGAKGADSAPAEAVAVPTPSPASTEAAQPQESEASSEPMEAAPTKAPAPSQEADIANEAAASSAIRPEFKNAMDSYEAFYTDYCAMLEKYMQNPTDLTLLAQYSQLMSQAAEMDEAFKAWDSADLNSEELKYYLDVNNRVLKLLAGMMG